MIVFQIVERAGYLASIVGDLDMDEDLRAQALEHIKVLQSAFDRDALSNQWSSDNPGPKRLAPENVRPIKMLSSAVRTRVSYPKLTVEEVEELVSILNELERWLIDHQLTEQDFIRQAILDGVRQFRFRLERIGWLGWGYTIGSLRDVVGAYLALERASTTQHTSPQATAVVKRVQAALRTIYEKAAFVRDVTETADFALKLYGAATILVQGYTGISGLIAPPS